MDAKVFDRIEKKYLITSTQKTKILKTIKQKMRQDGYFKSEVFNLYFDTDNYDLIIQSMDRPDFKEKLRARSYKGYDRVFLEIKTKMRGRDDANIGYKRRIMITHDDFDELIKRKNSVVELSKRAIETGDDIQIAREVDYLISHFDLKPKILVSYNRESYKGDDDLRVTFDSNLKYRAKNLKLTASKYDKIYFKDKKNIIMEVKARGSIPLWLVKIMSERKIYPTQFSKIGKSYEKLRKEKNV